MEGRSKENNVRRLAEVFITAVVFTDDQFAQFIESLNRELEDDSRYHIVHRAIEKLVRIREQGPH